MTAISANIIRIIFLGLVLFFTVFQGKTIAQNGEDEREPVIWSISFDGNESYSSMVLREVIAAESPNFWQKLLRRHGNFIANETELRRDRVRLERYYQRRGYHNVNVQVTITPRDKEWQRNVKFTITEGLPLEIVNSSIVVEADDQTRSEISDSREFLRETERHEYQEGNRYETVRAPDVRGRFLRLFENQGYAWPEVEINSVIDSLANQVDVEIVARPGPKTYFSGIELEGDLSVPDRVVIRETDIKEGDLYNRNKLQEAQRQIFSHHLFRFATINIPEQPRDSTLDIRIRVRERPLRTIQTSIGFGREELLRGQLSWRHRNVHGSGNRFGISGRASFIDQRLSADYLIPYVFNTKSGYVSTVFGQHKLEPSFELFQGGLNNSLIYQARRNVTASASYEFSINEELSRDSDASLPDSVLNYNISSLSFTGYYSQGISREPRGWVIQPLIELSGLFGETTYSFQKFSLDVRNYTPLYSSLTLATRINTGAIFYTQPDSLPSNIRFYAGGTNSVRGWSRQDLGPKRAITDENDDLEEYVSLGGRALFNFNVELRQQLNFLIPNFGIAAFLDGGQVWRAINRVNERPMQFGAGGGLRYQSPIGPVRIDVAYKLNPTNADLNIYNGVDYGSSWDRIGIHFSIGQAF
ncbi:MAG: BamA/TamA family outer membrane protein [Balneolaceae bacterium]